jgi:hypothetical protein
VDCGSQRFEEIINNHKENLKYLKQLEATYTSLKQGQTEKFKALLLNAVGLPFKDVLEDILGNSISFESLIGGLQLLAITNPAALGAVLEKELNNLQEYFQGELELILLVYASLEEGLHRLDHDWSDLKDFNSFLVKHRKSLNDFFNNKLPRAKTHIAKSKTHLIVAENSLYNTNVLDDDTHFMEQLDSARYELSRAKAFLQPDETDPMSTLISFEAWFKDFEALLSKLSGVNLPSWNEMKSGFENVGDRFKNFLEALNAAATSIAAALVELDGLEGEIQSVWGKVHQDLIKNGSEDSIRLAGVIFSAIDSYLNTGIVRPLPLPIPMVGVPVSQTTLKQWEAQANAYKPFQGVWYNKVDEVERMLVGITTGGTRDALRALETIYTPVTNAVIGLYESVSAPFWRRLFYLVTLLRGAVHLMMTGQNLSTDLVTILVDLRGQLLGIKTALENVGNYFSSENPVESLRDAMGITTDVKALFHGFSSLADSLGFDFFSQLLQMGDFASALTLKENEADTVQQLLNCLRSVDHQTAEKKGAAMEIQKIAASEKLRKNKLQRSFALAIQEGVKAQEETIAKYQALLDKYNQQG